MTESVVRNFCHSCQFPFSLIPVSIPIPAGIPREKRKSQFPFPMHTFTSDTPMSGGLNIITSCAQTLYACRVLRAHGTCEDSMEAACISRYCAYWAQVRWCVSWIMIRNLMSKGKRSRYTKKICPNLQTKGHAVNFKLGKSMKRRKRHKWGTF